MLKLQEWRQIKLEVNSRFTHVTVCNWDTYQKGDFESEQPVNSQRTAGEQPVNNQRTAGEHPNKEKNEGRGREEHEILCSK